MLRSFNDVKEWDEAIPYCLMAYREMPVADLGFSPYKLVFGHPVNSPLAVVYNLWWDNDPRCHAM